MKFKHTALCTSLLGVLALSACGGDDGPDAGGLPDTGVADTGIPTGGQDSGSGPADTGTRPDTGSGPTDTGGTGSDTGSGTTDTGGTDAGATDTSVGGDGAVSDSGVPVDAGVAQQNAACVPEALGANNEILQGNCADGLVCAPWNAADILDGDPAIASCIKLCTSDVDCGGNFPKCTDATSLVMAEEPVGIKFCAPAESAQASQPCAASGGVADFVGCVDGTACALGFGLEPNEGVCGVPCQLADTEQPAGDCPAGSNLTVCNPIEFGNLPVRGFCADRSRVAGDACSQDDPAQACDILKNGVCVAVPNFFSQDVSQFDQICLELCDVTTATTTTFCPETRAKAQGGTPLSCVQVNKSGSSLGVCSTECSALPDDCHTNPNWTNHVCHEFQFSNSDGMSVCGEIPGPYVPREWVYVNVGGEIVGTQDTGHINCGMDPRPCQPASFCLATSSAQTDGACLTLCDVATATVSDCEVYNDPTVTCQGGLGSQGNCPCTMPGEICINNRCQQPIGYCGKAQ